VHAPLISQEPEQERLPVIVLMPWWGRTILLALAGLVVLVFAIAFRLDPYRPDGTALMEETHRQLGLPPCTFRAATGLPCPSCGMSTSFALLVRGDLGNSLRANAVGTLLALFSLAFLPWALVSAYRGHMLFITSVEGAVTRLVVFFLVLMMLRWGIVLLVYHS
jgi:hypothetical protein